MTARLCAGLAALLCAALLAAAGVASAQEDRAEKNPGAAEKRVEEKGAAGQGVEERRAALLRDWRGRYVCNQGETGLILAIDRVAPRADGKLELRARFIFHAIDVNPRLPTGCFAMSGVYDPATGAVALSAGRWLRRPDGPGENWVTVDLEGRVAHGAGAVAGRIIGYNCTTFSLKRALERLDAGDICFSAPAYSAGAPATRLVAR